MVVMRDDVADASDLRPGGTCPLCRGVSRPQDRLAFGPKPGLPDVLLLEWCSTCNFLFAINVSACAYRSYYASVRNDADHVVTTDRADSLVRLQTERLAEVLPAAFVGSVLDFGCGEGRLLQALARRFPAAALYGYDVADFLPASTGIRPLRTIDDLVERFDVIVLSHVAEHLVRFDVIDTLRRLLALRGLLYLEVPNPARYTACPRREFLYYIDRLHINHFSMRAMRRLVGRSGLEVRATGTHRFAYRDGHYPSMYCIASDFVPGRDEVPVEEVDEGPLDAVYLAYRADERRRALELRSRLLAEAVSPGVLVYGGGDNFCRARGAGGPLEAVPLLAVMDRRAPSLTSRDGIRFSLPDDALARYPEASVVVTVSQRSAEIAAAIGERWPHRRLFFA